MYFRGLRQNKTMRESRSKRLKMEPKSKTKHRKVQVTSGCLRIMSSTTLKTPETDFVVLPESGHQQSTHLPAVTYLAALASSTSPVSKSGIYFGFPEHAQLELFQYRGPT